MLHILYTLITIYQQTTTPMRAIGSRVIILTRDICYLCYTYTYHNIQLYLSNTYIHIFYFVFVFVFIIVIVFIITYTYIHVPYTLRAYNNSINRYPHRIYTIPLQYNTLCIYMALKYYICSIVC